MNNVVLRNGAQKRLVWGSDESGCFRAKDYFEGLTIKDRAKFEPLFDRMANLGLIRNTEQFRQEAPNLFAFKRFKHRLICFFDAGDVVLISGFTKKGDRGKRVSRNLQNAIQLRDSYLRRKSS